MKKYTILWDTINDLSFSEVCDWLDIPIVKNKIQCPSSVHEDNHPSCSIKDDRFCHCFACGYSATPLKLIQTVKNISKFEAVKYIHQHTPVLRIENTVEAKDIYLTKWELHCLGLKDNPLYPVKITVQEDTAQENKKRVEYDSLTLEAALEIINDKNIEFCATEALFLKRYCPYAKKIIHKALLGELKVGKNPADEMWKFPDIESYQRATKEYEERVDKFVFSHTGLHFDILQEWFFEGRAHLIDKAITLKGQKLYRELESKMGKVIRLLEEQEEIEYDRQSTPTMA